MSEIIFPNLWMALVAAREHSKKHQSEIISADDPSKLLLGWCCTTTGRCFYLRLVDIRSRRAMTLPFEHSNLDAILAELIRTTDGRANLAKFLSHKYAHAELEDILDRYMNLKAFW